jgi:hypothetical protein
MSHTISPIIYKLFTKLSAQEQADFLRDMLKIEAERIEEEDFEPSDDKRFDNADGVVYE